MSSIRSVMCRLAGTTGRSMTSSLSPWQSSATATRRDLATRDLAVKAMTIPPGPPGPPGPQDRSPESDVTASAPTCVRHPGRETYVSCVRCGRPACPDCLRSAAVGQQCVECIREGNRSIRQPRTVFGGRVAATALVTWTLVGINVAFYLTEWIYPKIVVDLSMIGNAPLTNT